MDLLYIAERVKPEITLCFADDNFGMYARDVEIADYIGWLQDHYSWPRYIRTTTGKNNGERIIQVMRKTRGALPMTVGRAVDEPSGAEEHQARQHQARDLSRAPGRTAEARACSPTAS